MATWTSSMLGICPGCSSKKAPFLCPQLPASACRRRPLLGRGIARWCGVSEIGKETYQTMYHLAGYGGGHFWKRRSEQRVVWYSLVMVWDVTRWGTHRLGYPQPRVGKVPGNVFHFRRLNTGSNQSESNCSFGLLTMLAFLPDYCKGYVKQCTRNWRRAQLELHESSLSIAI